jgi:transposase
VLIDHTNGRVLEVLESREQLAVVAWLMRAKRQGLLDHLEEVTCDMWDAYVAAARAVLGPQVRITIDRFHVMQNFQEGLDRSRRQIQGQLPKEAASELKGSRWLWLTNPENLEAEQLQELERLKGQFPTLAALSEQREALRQIFEDRTIHTAEQGEARLRQWCVHAAALGLRGLDGFCKTLNNWMNQIANYFVSRSSNGQTEGFNRGIRAILCRSFGMTSFTHLRQRILHVFS